MAIQRKQNFLGGQRVDVPHLKAIESAVASDFSQLINGVLGSGDDNYVIRGFSHNAQSSPVAAASWKITLADSVVLSKTGEICLYQFPSTAADIYPFQNISFSNAIPYFVGVKISPVKTDANIVKFIDDVTDKEISKTVPLAITLEYTVQTTTSSPDLNDPNVVWIYSVTVVGGDVDVANITYPSGTARPFEVDGVHYDDLFSFIAASSTRVAGGILGYTNSTYPNPTGLAGDIPIKATSGSIVTFKGDDVLGGTGTELYFYAGNSEDATANGGSLLFQAGDAISGTGDGGSIFLDAGGTTGGNEGKVYVGTQSSGTVVLGREAYSVQTVGRNAEMSKDHTPVAANTITVDTSTVMLQPSGTITMTAAPTLPIIGIEKGTIVTLIGNSTGSTVLQRHGATLTKLKLAASTRTIRQYDTMRLIFDGTYWCELSYSDNS